MNTNPNGHDCNELVDGQYLLDDDAAWFIVSDFNIRIESTEEGVVVNIYKLDRENDDPIASTHAFDNEYEREVQRNDG